MSNFPAKSESDLGLILTRGGSTKIYTKRNGRIGWYALKLRKKDLFPIVSQYNAMPKKGVGMTYRNRNGERRRLAWVKSGKRHQRDWVPIRRSRSRSRSRSSSHSRLNRRKLSKIAIYRLLKERQQRQMYYPYAPQSQQQRATVQKKSLEPSVKQLVAAQKAEQRDRLVKTEAKPAAKAFAREVYPEPETPLKRLEPSTQRLVVAAQKVEQRDRLVKTEAKPLARAIARDVYPEPESPLKRLEPSTQQLVSAQKAEQRDRLVKVPAAKAIAREVRSDPEPPLPKPQIVSPLDQPVKGINLYLKCQKTIEDMEMLIDRIKEKYRARFKGYNDYVKSMKPGDQAKLKEVSDKTYENFKRFVCQQVSNFLKDFRELINSDEIHPLFILNQDLVIKKQIFMSKYSDFITACSAFDGNINKLIDLCEYFSCMPCGASVASTENKERIQRQCLSSFVNDLRSACKKYKPDCSSVSNRKECVENKCKWDRDRGCYE